MSGDANEARSGEPELRPVAEWLRSARSVVVLSGAGISTDSGIPDFRGPRGVWTRDPEAERLSNIEAYTFDADVRRRAWQARLHHPAWEAEPNAAHHALAQLQHVARSNGCVVHLLTQNIDGLHTAAGGDDVLELHGTLHRAKCLGCDMQMPTTAVLSRVGAGEADPRCTDCGGILKTAVVYFGEPLDHELMRDARDRAAACEVLLAVGTSLSVHPVAGLCDVALARGARLVTINAEPTPYDEVADQVVRQPVGEVLPALVEAVTSAELGRDEDPASGMPPVK